MDVVKNNNVNPWQCEAIADFGGTPVKLRCRMDHFAMLCAVLEVDNLLDVMKALQSLAPEMVKEAAKILAVNPADVEKYWVKLDGLKGMIPLRDKILEVMDGVTPDERAQKDEALKKLHAAAQSKNVQVIEMLVAALLMMETQEEILAKVQTPTQIPIQ